MLLANGGVYVVDFGIAKALIDTAGERLTSAGLAIGTPAYMSPEQASAGQVDERSDEYSLATILYEMLAGEPPFSGPDAQAIIARRLAEPARPLHAVRSTVPEPVERAVLKALERVPADRFPDVSAFAAALQGTASSGMPRLVRRSGSRRVFIAAGLLAVTAMGAWLFASRGRVVGARTKDPEVAALYQRGLRAYDRRTPGGVVEAITDFNAAIGRDSAYAPAWTALAKSYIRAQEREFAVPGLPQESLLPRAVAAVDRALAGSALVEARAERRPEARAVLRRADSLAVAYVPTPLHTAVYLAQAYAALGEVDRAVQWLTRYKPRRDLHFQLHLRCDPPFDPIRGDQRFRSLLTLPAPPPGRGF